MAGKLQGLDGHASSRCKSIGPRRGHVAHHVAQPAARASYVQRQHVHPAAQPPAAATAQAVTRRGRFLVRVAQPMASDAAAAPEAGSSDTTRICTSVTAPDLDAFLAEIQEAIQAGVDIVELRLDFLRQFDPSQDLQRLMDACTIPFIITYRPAWEGGNYTGPEPERLAALKLAAIRGAPFVDVEYKAAPLFFAGGGEVPVSCQVILSSHNFAATPPQQELHALAAAMRDAGADIVKIACFANDISDSAAVLSLLQQRTGPTIALAMGEKGQVTRLLAAKYGGFLTFAALSPERASAPGQPTVAQLQQLYRFRSQAAGTKLFGIVGNPVHHSKSPAIHNPAFQHIGFDGVYLPLLVDSLDGFLAAFASHDFAGFSVTIPHKEAALAASSSVDPVAAQIGAVNTLLRQPDGSYRGYNTDWLAAISAIEHALPSAAAAAAAAGTEPHGSASSSSSGSSNGSGSGSPLEGRSFLVVGAGGAGKALAFGAASRGAKVLIANRNRARAEALAAAVPGGATVVGWEDLQSGAVGADVLANTTSVGMVPNVEDTPVAAPALKNFKLVFDAVYTPRHTRLLRDAAAAGCVTVDGVAMFVGQAVEQFRLFTGGAAPPVDVMEAALLGSSKPTPTPTS